MAHTYISANQYCKSQFGCKVYKLAMSAAVTCPNRDGTLDTRGCIFCSSGGSGDFAAPYVLSVPEQIAWAKKRLGSKGEGLKYIAYFQSFTGTYGDIDRLESMYLQAAEEQDIVGVSIATRPDCLGPRVMKMLENLCGKTTVWVELGLQTVREDTAKLIRRGYPLAVYEDAMDSLSRLPIHRITHVILGLPGETREDVLKTVRYVGERTDGIKLQLLHVIEGTDLADMYRSGAVSVLGMEEYCDIVTDAILALPESVVIHRMTGDGAKRSLVAPLWSGDKKRVLNELKRKMTEKGISLKSEL